MRLAWATDIHLDLAGFSAVETFLASLVEASPDALLITGDLGESGTWRRHLRAIEDRLAGKPVWFVLGNHDYYRSSIRAVRAQAASERWLPARGVVLLSEDTALVGHDGWADGRFGDYAGSRVMLNDFLLISELVSPSPILRRHKLEELGDEAAAHFRHWLPVAANRRKRVLIATHVPPFREACWHEGRISDDDWLPHFSCAATGRALAEAAEANPSTEFLVLCGHTHGAGYVRILPNLEVFTGGAEYGRPSLQRVLEL
jgi:3',5'-cyclic-AMP phosphodiesterase